MRKFARLVLAAGLLAAMPTWIALPGRAVPLTFGLGGDHGTDILPDDSPNSRRADCGSGADLNDVSPTTTAGSSSLQHDPLTDRYSYVWKTNPAWIGQCRDLTVTFDDGSSATLRFRFR